MSKKDLNDPGAGIIAQEIGSSDPGYGAVPPDYSNMSSGYGTDTITIDTSYMGSSITSPTVWTTSATVPNGGFVTGTAGSTLYSSGAGTGYAWNTATSSTVNISANGIDMAAGTDITVAGKSLKQFMDKMEERLAILVPDPKKLEKFEALKKAYEHYKLMEKLCQEETKED